MTLRTMFSVLKISETNEIEVEKYIEENLFITFQK